MLAGDTYISGLTGSGPPPWSFNDSFVVPRWFLVETVAALRQLRTHQFNNNVLLVLLGQDEPYDGLLQGTYQYWPNMSTAQPDDGGTWIWANDQQSAWRKIN